MSSKSRPERTDTKDRLESESFAAVSIKQQVPEFDHWLDDELAKLELRFARFVTPSSTRRSLKR